MKSMILVCIGIAALGACGSDDEPSIDVEGCEHLQEGPFVDISASAARDASAPAVAANHASYTTALRAAVSYVSFAAPEATDYIVFLDQPVTFAVFDASGAAVALEESADSSPECTTIRGKHTFELPVGTAFFGLGDGAMTVNVVVEEAAGHAE